MRAYSYEALQPGQGSSATVGSHLTTPGEAEVVLHRVVRPELAVQLAAQVHAASVEFRNVQVALATVEAAVAVRPRRDARAQVGGDRPRHSAKSHPTSVMNLTTYGFVVLSPRAVRGDVDEHGSECAGDLAGERATKWPPTKAWLTQAATDTASSAPGRGDRRGRCWLP